MAGCGSPVIGAWVHCHLRRPVGAWRARSLPPGGGHRLAPGVVHGQCRSVERAGVGGFGRPGEVGCLPAEDEQGGRGDRTCGTVSDQAGLVVRIAAAGARIACAVP